MKCQYYSTPQKNRIRPQILILLITGLIILPKSSLYAESAIMLYDIDFGTPPHTVGQAPVVGTGSIPRNTPTSINISSPKVVDAVGAFTNQPVQFTVPGSKIMAQLEFGITSNEGFSRIFPRYIIEMDILVASLALPIVDSGFTIILDTPQVRRIDFEPDESIRMFNPKIGTEIIGGYSLGVPVALSVFVDLESDQWTISVDDTQKYSGIFGASELKKFRISLGDYEHQGNIAAVDNIKVYGVSDSDILTGLEIIGPKEVPFNSWTQYKAIASYNDGSAANVTSFATWSLNTEDFGTLDNKGILTTNNITGDMVVFAQYTEGDITMDTQRVVSCIPDQPESALNKIYWTTNWSIQCSSLDGLKVTDLATQAGFDSPGGIAIDETSGKMYWTNTMSDKIRRADMDATNIEDLVSTASYCIALGGGKMYWIDNLTNIQRANLDGSEVEDLITNGLRFARALAIDVNGGKIYWADTGWPLQGIKRANLDGSWVEELITTDLSDPSGIAIDVNAGKIYWTDASGSDAKIERANLDGSGRETLIMTGLHLPRGVVVDSSAGKMYWADSGTNKIQRANLDGSGVQDIITGIDRPSGIALYIPFPDAKLTGLEIQGLQEVRENSHFEYTVIAQYDNGYTLDVTDFALWWVEPNNLASIEGGQLRTRDINELEDITIYAQHAEVDTILVDTFEVQITFPHILNVPSEHQTIQEAIDNCINGDVVLIAPDTYTGIGNRDIDFLGKAITVRSTDPNNPDVVAATIIDCNGTEEEPHRGFYFHRGETSSSILAGLTINNGYAPEKIIYWGDYPWAIRVGGGILFDGSSPTVIGCTVSDCNANYGGGVSCGFIGHPNDSSPTITNCAIQSNSAQEGAGLYFYRSNANLLNCDISANTADSYGGGVHIWGSIPTISHCKISGNSAKMGGGGINGNSGYGFPSGQGVINFCRIIGNSAQYGGGVRRFGGSIMNSIISDNKAEFRGGGLDYSDCLIHNCTISGNTARFGGGLQGCDGTIINCVITGNRAQEELFYGGEGGGFSHCEGSIINCLIAGNKAKVFGGGLRLTYGPIVNCTVSGNSAGNAGGGMYCYWRSHSIITNSIFWANYAPDGPDIHWKLNSTARISYTDLPGGWPGEGNIDADPYFVGVGYWADANDPNIVVEPNDPNAIWADGDYHLLPDSPCIDAGDPNYIAEPNETDLDSRPRIIGGRIDMGAYESPVPAEVRIVPRTINLTSKGKWITCHISLPEEYNVADIDPNSIFLEDAVPTALLSVDEQKQVATAKFNREELRDILNVGQTELTITGQLTDGCVFEATDTIKVIDKAGKK